MFEVHIRKQWNRQTLWNVSSDIYFPWHRIGSTAVSKSRVTANSGLRWFVTLHILIFVFIFLLLSVLILPSVCFSFYSFFLYFCISLLPFTVFSYWFFFHCPEFPSVSSKLKFIFHNMISPIRWHCLDNGCHSHWIIVLVFKYFISSLQEETNGTGISQTQSRVT